MNKEDTKMTPCPLYINNPQPQVSLTPRAHACLHMGVPETGDDELDAIIRKGNSMRLAGMAMQGLCANKEYITKDWKEIIVKESVTIADYVLKELEE